MLVAFGIMAFTTGNGDDSVHFWVLELVVGTALAADLEACFAEVGEEVSDFLGMGLAWEILGFGWWLTGN